VSKSIYKILKAKSALTKSSLVLPAPGRKKSNSKKDLKNLNEHRGALQRRVDTNFKVSQQYIKSLPDVMKENKAIAGAKVEIQHVGVSNFKVPLSVAISSKINAEVEASIVGTVSLKAHLKGINMSRILRSFYDYKNKTFNIDLLAQILKRFKRELESESARLKVSFSFPLSVESLRSNLEGYQYYDATLEAIIDSAGQIQRFVELDFVYSSACPCSSELAEHARETRGIYGIPHSQRSKARLRVELKNGKQISLLELRKKCLEALKTETQVMVKREDEQAFAELNGYYEKFVEDAARLLYEQLESDDRIKDFEVICGHFESLHSHDAVSAICKGVAGGMRAEFSDFTRLRC
jgi:GTP cyclohydrolase I